MGNLGDKVKRRRTELGMTQDDLSVKTGIDQGKISKLENGKQERINNKTKIKLQAALEVPDSFFEEDDLYEVGDISISINDYSDIAAGRLVKESSKRKIPMNELASRIVEFVLENEPNILDRLNHNQKKKNNQ